MTASTGVHTATRKTTTTEDGCTWLSAKCSCGKSSGLFGRKAQVTQWINRHLKDASV